MKNILFLFILTFSVSFLSCGEKKNETIDAEKKTTQQNTPAEDLEKQQQTSDKKEPETTNELGMSPGLPADFPSDIPKPKDGKVLGTVKSSDGTIVTFESPEGINEIVQFYKDQMNGNGYKIAEGEEKISDKGGFIVWNKNNKSAELMLSRNDDKKVTSIVITYK